MGKLYSGNSYSGSHIAEYNNGEVSNPTLSALNILGRYRVSYNGVEIFDLQGHTVAYFQQSTGELRSARSGMYSQTIAYLDSGRIYDSNNSLYRKQLARYDGDDAGAAAAYALYASGYIGNGRSTDVKPIDRPGESGASGGSGGGGCAAGFIGPILAGLGGVALIGIVVYFFFAQLHLGSGDGQGYMLLLCVLGSIIGVIISARKRMNWIDAWQTCFTLSFLGSAVIYTFTAGIFGYDPILGTECAFGLFLALIFIDACLSAAIAAVAATVAAIISAIKS